VCIVIFIVEYLVRLLTVHSHMGASSCLSGLVRTLEYAKKPMNIIDLVSVLPFIVEVILPPGEGPVTLMYILRMTRTVRLLKLTRRNVQLNMFVEAVRVSRQPLFILMVFNGIVTVVFASLIHFAEGGRFSVDPKYTQPALNSTLPAPFPLGVFVRLDKAQESVAPTPFRSLPYAMWWVCTTMTTVGYGDIAPTTPLGKGIGVCSFFIGIIFLALPISVLGANFEDLYDQKVEATGLRPLLRRTLSCRSFRAQKPFLPDADGVRHFVISVLEDPGASHLSQLYSTMMAMTILVGSFVFVIETMPDLQSTPAECDLASMTVEACMPRPNSAFFVFETVCIMWFSVDYFLRVTCIHTSNSEELGLSRFANRPLRKTLHYVRSPLNVVDFLAIIPWYMEHVMGGYQVNFAVLRVLRLIRVFRLFKQPQMRSWVAMFYDVVMESLPALVLLVYIMGLTSVFFASLVFFAEGSTYSMEHFKDQRPRGAYVRPTVDGYGYEVSPYSSIAYSLWWFFVTATTVGYGDDVPTTTMGRCVGVVAFYVGIVSLSLPISVISASFRKHYMVWCEVLEEVWQESQAEKEKALPEVTTIKHSSRPTATPREGWT